MPTALSDPDEHAALRLALLHRARAAPERPPPAHPARQGARRLLLDQRHWCTCAAIRSTSSAGRRKGRRAGATATCCRTSSAPSGARAGATTTAARTGKLATRRGLLTNPLHGAWLEAGRQAGYPLTADMNGFQQEGFGHDGHDGGRGAPLQRRQRLPAAGDAPARTWRCARMRSPRACCSRGAGPSACATGAATAPHEVHARREVICAQVRSTPRSC